MNNTNSFFEDLCSNEYADPSSMQQKCTPCQLLSYFLLTCHVAKKNQEMRGLNRHTFARESKPHYTECERRSQKGNLWPGFPAHDNMCCVYICVVMPVYPTLTFPLSKIIKLEVLNWYILRGRTYFICSFRCAGSDGQDSRRTNSS